MRWQVLLGWGCGLWIAAVMQHTVGGAMPGLLLLVALVAGLVSPTPVAVLVGACAGVCDAVVSGGEFALCVLLSLAASGAGIQIARRFSRWNLLTGMGTAALVSFFCAACIGLMSNLPLQGAMLSGAQHAWQNALWIIPIYGMVFLVSERGRTRI
jgi:hypothetical protein